MPKERQIELQAEVCALAVSGFEAADDLGVAVDRKVRRADGGEIGAVGARIGAAQITGALASDVDSDCLVVVWIVAFQKERG